MSQTPAVPFGLSLGARLVERSGSSGHTLVGTLDDPAPATVDHGGLVQPAEASWSVDWWIGADDRWYFPSREATVRQRRLGSGPVVETAVRIPSGDAIHRCYPVAVGGVTATVIEIENDSPVPVALALAVRPYGIEGETDRAVDADPGLGMAVQDRTIEVDGRTAVTLPRRPNERLAAIKDISDLVVEGQALTGAAECGGAGANAAVLYPLPHRTKLRFVVTSDGRSIAPTDVPDVEAVQRGWDSVVEAGGRFELPDNGLSARLAGARARLRVDGQTLADQVAGLHAGAGRRLQALAFSGSIQDLRVPLLALAGTFPTKLDDPVPAASIVAGAGTGLAVLNDADLATELLEVLAQLTHLVERRKNDDASGEALLGLSYALLAAGQNEPAAELAERAARLGHRYLTDATDVPAGLDRVTAAIESASATGAWARDDSEEAARFVVGARSLAVAETMVNGVDELHLLPDFPTGWLGGQVEVHQAATVHGLASFAIRWHGYRPALLWDLELTRPVTVRCPALDPEWSTVDARGETLLAGVANELPEPPTEGDSFV